MDAGPIEGAVVAATPAKFWVRYVILSRARELSARLKRVGAPRSLTP